MLMMLILMVLMCCMFFVWLLKLKLVLWYLLVVFMGLLLVMMVGSMIVFVYFWFFGVDYWMFLNLFDEECSIVEFFILFYLWECSNDSWFLVFVSVVIVVLVVMGMY